MQTEILRIIEGGLSNDHRKIISYSMRLADRLNREGQEELAKCILQKIDSTIPHSGAVSDALRMIPLDADSRLQIVEVTPQDKSRQKIILSPIVKKQVEEFIGMIHNQSALELAGVDVKKTMILYGKPGCGKTSIAHYISEETDLPLVVARLDGIVSSLLGSTAKNIRKIFDYIKSMPCILFLDEFDAIAKARDDERELGELKRVINSLLQNIDSMPTNCVLIAATNHPELLDKAVWRRFVQTVEIGPPEEDEVKDMIKIFTKPFTSDLSTEAQRSNLVKAMDGLTPSDIKTVFDRAKVKSVLTGSRHIALDQLLLGIFELKSKVKTEKNLVCFLSDYGLSQTSINKTTEISLRKIKQYLSTHNK